MPQTDGIPTAIAPERTVAIRDRLLTRGYEMAAVLERLGDVEYRVGSWSPRQLAASARELLAREPADALDGLIRAFFLASPVPTALLEEVFAPRDLEDLVAMGLLTPPDDAGTQRGRVALFECRGLLLATDPFVPGLPPGNPVMPLFPECYELAAALSRREVGDALDLCTGSGIHALLAARCSRRVTGVDISPRAIAFARFNAALNGITNVRFLEGDLFAAVAGETFDWILANPPYLPASDAQPGENFFAGGPGGDAVWSRIIRHLPESLRHGGIFQMIHLVVTPREERYEERLRGLLGDEADRFAALLALRPVPFRSPLTAGATVEFGMTNLKRLSAPRPGVYRRHTAEEITGAELGELLHELTGEAARGAPHHA